MDRTLSCCSTALLVIANVVSLLLLPSSTYAKTILDDQEEPSTDEHLVGNASNSTVADDRRQYLALLLLTIPLLTISGNILVVASVIHERNLRTITNFLICSLAISDFVVATFVMPFAVYVEVAGDWKLDQAMCDVYIAIDVCASTASILNLMAISIDRYIAVSKPLLYSSRKNHDRAAVTIAAVWLISLLIAAPILFGINKNSINTNKAGQSECVFTNAVFIIVSSISSFWIPCFVMIILYAIVFKKLRNRHRYMSKKCNRVSENVIYSNRSAAATEKHHNQAELPRHRQHRAAVDDRQLASSFRSEPTGRFRFSRRKRQQQQALQQQNTSSSDDSPLVSQYQTTTANHSSAATTVRLERKGPSLTDRVRAAALPMLPDAHNHSIGRQAKAESLQLPDFDSRKNSGLTDSLLTVGTIGSNSLSFSVPYIDQIPFIDSSVDTEPSEDNSKLLLETSDSRELAAAAAAARLRCQSEPPINCASRQQSPEASLRYDKRYSEAFMSPEGDNGSAGGGSQRHCGFFRHKQQQQLKSNFYYAKSPRTRSCWRLLRRMSRTLFGDRRDYLLRRKKSPVLAVIKQIRSREHRRERRERKATQTLAIVVGVFLICWVPFFICHTTNALCRRIQKTSCIGFQPFFLTTWIGYMNSFMNPIIYTIFNPEFRRAFRKILDRNRSVHR